MVSVFTREAERILKDLVKIDSQVSKSNKEIVDYIRNELSEFESEKYSLRNSLFNLVVKRKGTGRPIVFAGHVDTVNVCNGWNTNPFKSVVKNGKLFGLGACDMKGGLTAMILTAKYCKNKRPVLFVFTADEEGSALGAKRVVKDLVLENADVIVCEPTRNELRINQKGCVGLRIITKGKSLHAGRTCLENNKKNSAIYKMLKIAMALQEYEKTLPENSSLNIGTINGGSGENVVPDYCEMRIDRRVSPEENISVVLDELKNVVGDCEVTFYGENFNTCRNSSLVKYFEGCADGIGFFGGWTEAGLYKKWGDCVVFGPGNSELAHKANEYVILSEITEFVKIYSDLTKKTIEGDAK